MTNSQMRQKILIVDDHPATRKLLDDILHNEFDVFSAQSGEKALELIKTTPGIDLILLDIIMPGIDGYEVCKLLKSNAQFSNIPIIFLTVMAEENDEAKGFAAGVSDYIIKPISRLRLLARVKNQLKMQHQKKLLEQKNTELEAALEQNKVLRGILPICSHCKQIRDDDGNWQQLEWYIQTTSEAKFSHSICPECLKTHYPDY